MKTTDNELNTFLKHLQFLATPSEKELGYQDPFATEQQLARDKQITLLLTEYVCSYKKKVKHSTICRYLILCPCIVIVCIFAGLLISFSCKIVNAPDTIQVADLVAFITACISFISLIIGLLTIITKYFFPENDEQYITAIVESIQKNDLENKRENAKHDQSASTPTEESNS